MYRLQQLCFIFCLVCIFISQSLQMFLGVLILVFSLSPTQCIPPIPPNIQCKLITLIVEGEYPEADVVHTFDQPFRSQPHSCLGISAFESVIKHNLMFSMDISLGKEDHKGLTILFKLENDTRLVKLEVSVFSFLKETAHYLAVTIVERENLTKVGVTGKGYRRDDQIQPLALKDAIGQPDIHLLPFIKGFRMHRQSNNYFAVGVKLLPLNQTHYTHQIYTLNPNSIHRFSYYRIEYTPVFFTDGSIFESTHIFSKDSPNHLPFQPALPNHFHVGINFFDCEIYPSFQFIYPNQLPLTSYSRTLNVTIFSYRMFPPCPEGKAYDNRKKCVECGTGEYISKLTAHCEKCHVNCQTCEEERKCILCKPVMVKIKGGFCGCPDGMFQLGDRGACMNCDPGCLTCFGNKFNCTVFKDGSQGNTSPDQRQPGKPQTRPEIGKQSSSRPPPPPNPTNISCPSHSFLHGYQCICNEGLYMSNAQICEKCENLLDGCAKCNPERCLGCKSPKVLIQNTCQCPKKMYLKGNQCVQCKKGCLVCNQNTCIECDRLNSYYLQDGQCRACPNNKFVKDGQCKECFELISHCDQCTLSGTCKKCVYRYSLAGGRCLKCQQTLKNCLTCSSQTECLTCRVGFSLENGTCVCGQGMKLQGKSCIKIGDKLTEAAPIDKQSEEEPVSSTLPEKMSLIGGLVLFLCGLYTLSSISVSLLTLLQLCYLLPSLLPSAYFLSSRSPLSLSFYHSYVFGYNNLIPLPAPPSSFPQHYLEMEYRANFSTAVNFMVFLVVVLVIVAKMLGKVEDGPGVVRSIKERAWKVARILTMGLAMDMGFSLGLQVSFSGQTQELLGMDIAFAVVAHALFVFFLYTDYSHPELCEPTRLKPSSLRLHNPLFYVQKYLLSLLISLTSTPSVVFLFHLLYLLYLFFSQPYTSTLLNSRLLLTQLLFSSILLFAVVKGGDTMFAVIMVLVLVDVGVSGVVWAAMVMTDDLGSRRGHVSIIEEPEKMQTDQVIVSTAEIRNMHDEND